MYRHPRQVGFTLIEVLVSITVMAMAFAVLFRIMSAANIGVRSASEYRTALAVAESKMAELVADKELSIGEWTGDMGDVRWTQRARVDNDVPLSVAANGYALRRFEVDVTWQAGDSRRLVSLSTYRYRNENR